MNYAEISKETILDYQSVEYKFTDNIKEMYNMWKNPSTRNIAYKFANILDPDEKKLTIKEYKSRLAKNRNSRLELDSLMRLYEEAGTERGHLDAVSDHRGGVHQDYRQRSNLPRHGHRQEPRAHSSACH